MKRPIFFRWKTSTREALPDSREQVAKIIRSFRAGMRAGNTCYVAYDRATGRIEVGYSHTQMACGVWTRKP